MPGRKLESRVYESGRRSVYKGVGGIAYAGVPQTFGPAYIDLSDASGDGYHGAERLSSTPNMAPHVGRPRDRSVASPLSSEDTVDLLELVKIGDRAALDRLLQRCIPPLRRWAHGRLPPAARAMHDTGDLVQETVIAALRRLEAFEARYQGALQAYLRQAVANHIRDEIRKASSRKTVEGIEDPTDPRPSPLEQAIGRENLERYETALASLRPIDREAIVARLELQQSYEEVAIALQKPTANAARVAVARAVKNLVKAMGEAAARGGESQV